MLIALFTYTAAMLNSFDLRSIIGCPGGIAHFVCIFELFSEHFFLEEDCNGKKDPCAVF